MTSNLVERLHHGRRVQLRPVRHGGRWLLRFRVVLGVTDPAACNYDPSATQDDGSCDLVERLGCTTLPAATSTRRRRWTTARASSNRATVAWIRRRATTTPQRPSTTARATWKRVAVARIRLRATTTPQRPLTMANATLDVSAAPTQGMQFQRRSHRGRRQLRLQLLACRMHRPRGCEPLRRISRRRPQLCTSAVLTPRGTSTRPDGQLSADAITLTRVQEISPATAWWTSR